MGEFEGGRRRGGPVRGPQSVAAGLGLVGLGLFGLYASSDLPRGTLNAIGPGLMPYWLSLGVAACGLALAVAGLLREGAPLPAFSLRGPAVVALAILAFAVTIRPFAWGPVAIPGLGLIVAGPLAVILSGYASREARFLDLAILALLLTAGCMLLFGDLLNLPIPIFPTALVDALAGTLPARVLLRLGAGTLALAGLALLALRRRAGRGGPVDVAPHSLTT